MKKHMILFALLSGLLLVMFETAPKLRVSAQCITNVCPPAPTNASDAGSNKSKNNPHPLGGTSTPTAVPRFNVPQHPQPYPQPYPGPATPFPLATIPPVYDCKFPCWVFPWQSLGDPVELLAGGGLIVLLLIGGFIFFRSRLNLGGGGK